MKLMISDTLPPAETFRDEIDQYFQRLESMRGYGAELSELISSKHRVTFIRGIAGIGKSVLMKQLTYKWAKGELFKDFKLCITFECRELNYFAMNYGFDLKKHELVSEFLEMRFKFDFGNTRCVVFIIDGLDELFDIKENESIIGQLLDLNKSRYAESKMIITGRPHIEDELARHGGNLGGLRKFEVHGLSDEQIENYISKFADSDDDTAIIKRAKHSSKNTLPILHVPQFLNSFCCVAVLSGGQKLNSIAELYCWTLYLLLKQHAEKDGPNNLRIPEVFTKYAKELLLLSKMCFELLNKNTIIFERSIELQFGENPKGMDFVMGLFIDVSDNFKVKKQFKHVTLMEFFSAIYVCTTETPMEIITEVLRQRYYQVLLFHCQLISGLMYDGMIKQMFTNAAGLKEIDCEQFLRNTLKLIGKCVKSTYDANCNKAFDLSIDVIICLMNEDVANKAFILSIVNELSFENVDSFSTQPKLIEMIKLLLHEFKCTSVELRKALENLNFKNFYVNELTDLKYAKFLASIYHISMTFVPSIQLTVGQIRREIDEITEYGKCKIVSIYGCKFQDEDFDDEAKECVSKLDFMWISRCKFYKKSFVVLCDWVMASSVEEFRLDYVEGLNFESWKVLVDVIVKMKVEGNGELALTRLKINECAFMKDELKRKVIYNIYS